MFFFTNGGAEANENAMKIARWVTGRQKILAFYRSYHGGTAGAISATGDPRRWTEPSMPGIVHVLNPYHGIERGWDTADQALAYLEEVIQLEGPSTIAGILLEPVVGTNGILVPPRGYLQGVRALCDRYGILMICDEVMSGFGRTGEWFAVNHWGVVPDVMTMAKGLTSAYVPMGAVGMRRGIADQFTDQVIPRAADLQQPSAGMRGGARDDLAVYEEDDLIARATGACGVLMAELLADLAAAHPSVGAVRSIGLFGIVELIRNRTTRGAAWRRSARASPEMAALGARFREAGLYTFVRWHSFFTNPPLCDHARPTSGRASRSSTARWR